MGSGSDTDKGNQALAAALLEAGRSNAALARRVNELGSLQGVVMCYDKASVTRWLQGMTPRDRAPEFIAAALSGFLGSVLNSDHGVGFRLRSQMMEPRRWRPASKLAGVLS
ncbi:hypothetical protein P3T29_000347 [Kitasatospora sp. MAP5-34]|nr:hypothetical protein [Kitasatospora sp. MAP5-34]